MGAVSLKGGMPTWSNISQSLTSALKLKQAPVAITMTDSVPDGVPSWEGKSPAGCRFWQEGASRTFSTGPRDHDLCAIGIHTHNLAGTDATTADLMTALRVFGDLGYVRAEDVPQIPVLANRPANVVYGPLADANVTPDAVMLFVDASQILVLTEAAQQIEGGATPAMGRPACAVVPQTINSGKAALSLGCCGARAYLDVMTDDVALFAIPGARIGEFSERVTGLAAANGILAQFHTIRRGAVEAGSSPTVEQSLAALQSRQ